MKFKIACMVIGVLYMFVAVGSYVDMESISFSTAFLLGLAGAMLVLAGIRKDN